MIRTVDKFLFVKKCSEMEVNADEPTVEEDPSSLDFIISVRLKSAKR